VRHALLAALGYGILLAFAACGARTELAGEVVDANFADVRHDAHTDATLDVAEEDVIPIPDAFPDVPIIDECPDAGATLVYLIGVQSDLYSFYPPTLAFNAIGKIACPSTSSPSKSVSVIAAMIAPICTSIRASSASVIGRGSAKSISTR
jgi:hypothetical protein